MNSKLIYDNIIKRAKDQDRKKGCGVYYEKHHILPRCLGGNNSKENLVLLTAKEHYICHLLLIHIYPDNDKIAFALWNMCRPSNLHSLRFKVSARGYEAARVHLGNVYKGRTAWNKGKKLTQEQLKNHATRQPEYKPWNKGLVCGPQSEETKIKRSLALKGRPRSDEDKKKMSEGWAKRKALFQ